MTDRAHLEVEIRTPSRHYSTNEDEPVFFYGGMFSNFDEDHPLFMIPHLAPPKEIFFNLPLRFASGEHWLHCGKARTWEEHEAIRRSQGPKAAKTAGRTIPLSPAEVAAWDAKRYGRMVVGLRAKAVQNPEVGRYLLATGDRFIAEDSPVDDVWGIRDKDGGLTGMNLLGQAWMQIRDELRYVLRVWGPRLKSDRAGDDRS